MPNAHLNGVDLFYEELGSGEPLVLLNGIMMTTASWGLQTPALSRAYRCILHDFRGQLRSGKPDVPWTMQTHVDDLVALLDFLQIDRAHIAGTSYGGEVGMMFAAAHPERVLSLVVITAVACVDEGLRAGSAMWAAAARRDPFTLYDVSAPVIFSDSFREKYAAVIEMGRDRLREWPAEAFEGFAKLCDAFGELDVRDQLRSIHSPTLVVAAENDLLKPPRCSCEVADAIPGAKLVVIPGAGHAVVLEAPQAVNALLIEFLAGVTSDRSAPTA